MEGLSFTLEELAGKLGVRFEGDPSLRISGVAGIREAKEGDLSFVSNSRYLRFINSTLASALVLSDEADAHGRPALRSDKPYLIWLLALKIFAPCLLEQFPPGLDEAASVHPSAKLGTDVHVSPGVSLGPDCRIGNRVVLMPGVRVLHSVEIGDDCVLFPNVVLREEVKIGERVSIHSGTVIGSDGFGYAWDGQAHRKIPQIGIVEVGNDVEIGANVTIDRATTGATRIGEFSRIDNLVQIAHNVQIGAHSVIVAQAGISGSAEVGSHVTVAGQAGLVGHIQIGDRATIAAQAGVTKSVPEGECVSGYPARNHEEALRQQAALARLPGLLKRIRSLERSLEAMKKKESEGEGSL
ncbi:MAG: UDP-3-O-(3-hydroxymyristoyl)glucosamine N-acyltransferase [Candidatus Krumholzibacteria bacterium]|nr:UDP-3-O-(3-hydroxymyristoyl)glucosamine N-acyltransferase [Candidatus Krumholzibacteria bacterium]MDP7020812.1 UDP-3-O-(3-hydroxymyristoyl)glucosamine N-acyltransferase [Candidatus Krumholzibacteria bacterium]